MRGQSNPVLACRICSSSAVSVFFELPCVPIHANVLWPERELALAAPLGEIRLGLCSDCGHIYNYAFDPELVAYRPDYENSLCFSPHFRRYAQALAADLVKRYDLRGKQIIEIGSGQGDFIRLLCDLGANRGVGFDPSYVADAAAAVPENVTFVPDFYSERYAQVTADFFCSRHVLEHLASPMDLLTSLRRTMGSRPASALYFEVPNALAILRDLAIWDIIYEHCSHFSPRSLSEAFGLAGFQVLRLDEVYQGQFLAIEARPGDSVVDRSPTAAACVQSVIQAVEGFAARHRLKVESWRRTLKQLTRSGQRVVAWGAGSKGVTFLNTFRTADLIEYIVDVNPRKHGAYVAGSGQRIMPTEFLRRYRPDAVIVMNAVYLAEIQQIVASLGLAPKLMAA